MSMLAGPRRKQKVINLRAKNNEWSNDSSKFGQRMLEKMGWTSGKGLGAKENGIVEHVVARYKNDEKGLGFEDRNDQWTKHEDDFNSLLANLSNANEDSKIQLHSGISLEDKSKKTKARIHYHKFTRGKDLSRYSEKDLANIFGKKSFNDKEEVETKSDKDIETSDQVFTEKGSMEDYFKTKMDALMSKNNSFSNKNKNRASELDWEDEPQCRFQGFLGSTNIENNFSQIKSQPFNCKELIENNHTDINRLEIIPKIKKKKKKCKENPDNFLFNIISDLQYDVKEHKNKHKKDATNNTPDTNIIVDNDKNLKRTLDEDTNLQEAEGENIHKHKKRKKRKNKDLNH